MEEEEEKEEEKVIPVLEQGDGVKVEEDMEEETGEVEERPEVRAITEEEQEALAQRLDVLGQDKWKVLAKKLGFEADEVSVCGCLPSCNVQGGINVCAVLFLYLTMFNMPKFMYRFCRHHFLIQSVPYCIYHPMVKAVYFCILSIPMSSGISHILFYLVFSIEHLHILHESINCYHLFFFVPALSIPVFIACSSIISVCVRACVHTFTYLHLPICIYLLAFLCSLIKTTMFCCT